MLGSARLGSARLRIQNELSRKNQSLLGPNFGFHLNLNSCSSSSFLSLRLSGELPAFAGPLWCWSSSFWRSRCLRRCCKQLLIFLALSCYDLGASPSGRPLARLALASTMAKRARRIIIIIFIEITTMTEAGAKPTLTNGEKGEKQQGVNMGAHNGRSRSGPKEVY